MESQYPLPGNQTFSSQLMMLDHQIALERVGGDEDLLREIVRLFLDECPRLIAHIQEAIDAGDTRRLEREAHSLKGSVANFGAEPVVRAALATKKDKPAGEEEVSSKKVADAEDNEEDKEKEPGASMTFAQLAIYRPSVLHRIWSWLRYGRWRWRATRRWTPRSCWTAPTTCRACPPTPSGCVSSRSAGASAARCRVW